MYDNAQCETTPTYLLKRVPLTISIFGLSQSTFHFPVTGNQRLYKPKICTQTLHFNDQLDQTFVLGSGSYCGFNPVLGQHTNWNEM